MNTVEQINDFFLSEAQRERAAGKEPRQLKVLLIDDDAAFNEMVRATLAKQNVTVEVSTDGESGVWQSFKESFDLILLDLKMPGSMDGADTLAKIKTDRPDARVVLCTAFARSDVLEKAMQFSPFGIVEKPFDILKLMDVFKHYNLVSKGT